MRSHMQVGMEDRQGDTVSGTQQGKVRGEGEGGGRIEESRKRGEGRESQTKGKEMGDSSCGISYLRC